MYSTSRQNSIQLRALLTLVILGFAFLQPAANAQQPIDPSRWEADMQAFEKLDLMNTPPEGAILLTGSSSIARWNDLAVAALAPLTVIPRGFGGSVMEDVLFHLDRVALKYKPRAILIYEGDNDTAFGIPAEKIISQLHEVIDRIHQALPETRIYVLSVKPSILRKSIWENAQLVNAGYRMVASADPLVHYVDVANPFLKADGSVMEDIFISDNLHLNTMGNLIWGASIRAALMPLEARHEAMPQD